MEYACLILNVKKKVSETNLACYEKIDYDIIDKILKRIILKNLKNL